MANIVKLFRNGGEMVTNIEDIITENKELRMVVETQGALIMVVSEQVQKLQETIEQVVDHVVDTKTKNYIGKRPEFISTAIEEVSQLSEKEIRKLINRAANRQQKGYMRIYSKLAEITGVDVYEEGKKQVTKNLSLGFENKGYSYINTLFVKGIEKEAAIVALDIIRNK